MKLKSPKFWVCLSIAYLAVLIIIMWFFDPDFAEMKSWALLIPLYLPLIVSICLKQKDAENTVSANWEMRCLLLIFTGIVAVFKLIFDSLR